MRIAIIPGDGIGKEVTAEAVKVLASVAQRSGKTIDLHHLPWSADHFLATGETLPSDGYRMLRDDFAQLVLTRRGSHCAFLEGHRRPRSWAHRMIAEYFAAVEDLRAAAS